MSVQCGSHWAGSITLVRGGGAVWDPVAGRAGGEVAACLPCILRPTVVRGAAASPASLSSAHMPLAALPAPPALVTAAFPSPSSPPTRHTQGMLFPSVRLQMPPSATSPARPCSRMLE